VSWNGADGNVSGDLGHPAARLVLEYAERDRLRRAAQPISLTKTARDGLGDRLVDRALRLGGVPELYRDGDWARVRPGAVRRIADSMGERLTTGRGAMFLGAPGTGKSTAAGLVCRATVRLGASVRYSYLPVLMDEMLDWRQRLGIVREQARCGLVVWDDLGVRELADWEIAFMDEIVETRYQARRPMVVTGNLTDAALRENPRLGRMVDRWRQRTAADMVAFSGGSQR
jgi:hypothetical protein